METRRPGASGPPAPASRCPECGAEVRCGAVLGEDTCWCAELPSVEPRLAEGESLTEGPLPACLCEACLRRRVTEERSKT